MIIRRTIDPASVLVGIHRGLYVRQKIHAKIHASKA